MAKKTLEADEKFFGSDDPAVAKSLNQLGMLYWEIGRYADAEPLLKRALDIHEKKLGREDPVIAASLFNLAHLYGSTRDYAKAVPIWQRLLSHSEKVLGPENPDTAIVCDNLGICYEELGDFTNAESYHRRALKTLEKREGPEGVNTLGVVHNLGAFYTKKHEYSAAIPYFDRALRGRDKILGSQDSRTFLSLFGLAQLYANTGDYDKAEPLYRRVTLYAEDFPRTKGEAAAGLLSSVGRFYEYQLLQFDQAEPIYLRALKIVETTLGPTHSRTADLYHILGSLYSNMRDYAKAESFYQRSIAINESYYGGKHRAIAKTLDNLASLYGVMGEKAKSESTRSRALEMLEELLGPDHEETAHTLVNLANTYFGRREYAKAAPLIQRAFKIAEGVGESNVHLNLYALCGMARSELAMGEHAGAELLRQRLLKNKTADSAIWIFLVTGVALEFAEFGKVAAALELGDAVQAAHVQMTTRLFCFTSEQHRLAYMAAWPSKPLVVFARLGRAPELALAVLRDKGIVLDSMQEDRLIAQASQTRESRELIDQLRATKQRLTHLVLEVPKDSGAKARERREAEERKLVTDVEQLEGTLARQVAGLGRARRALSVSVDQVQRAIPKQAVLLELLRYSHYLGTNKWEPRYGAIVLVSSGEPKWVPLGSAEAIEKNIAEYQTAVRTGPTSNVQRPKSPTPFSTLLQALYQQLWAPIEGAMPKGTKTAIISPDGALNFLSYATLLTPDDQFLSQKYSIRYVSSGRDLLKEKKPSLSKRVAIYANPDFGGKGAERLQGQTSRSAALSPVGTSSTPSLTNSGAVGGREVRDAVERVLTERSEGYPQLRYLDRRDLLEVRLEPLPGTAKESAALTAQAKKWDWPANVFVGVEASEAQLAGVESPRILHLATHGFFLPDVGEDGKTGKGAGESGGKGDLRGVGGVRPNFEPSPLGGFGGGGFDSGMVGGFNRPVALKNPMHRSGLALAGAQATLDAWKRGETPTTSNDGIVTADEVGTLKLEGTELVVLSACDTGIGAIKSGEGVLGLRRGFIQAGAENLLMTLWSVADDETAKIMADFYERFHTTGNASQALAGVQRDWLVKLRKEHDLQTAVRLAGPFILSSQGQP